MENIFTGKTVEEAVNAGLEELGLTAEDVDVEVLDEGKKRIIGSKPAQVKLTVREKKTDGERAVAFLEGLLPLLGIDAVATLKGEEEKIVIELTAPSAKNVIGRRGEIIDAVQTLAGAVANTGRKDYKRVVVDCENYREDREETLKRVANKLAAKAVRLGKRVRLEPMNPYERRIIHAALVDHPDVNLSDLWSLSPRTSNPTKEETTAGISAAAETIAEAAAESSTVTTARAATAGTEMTAITANTARESPIPSVSFPPKGRPNPPGRASNGTEALPAAIGKGAFRDSSAPISARIPRRTRLKRPSSPPPKRVRETRNKIEAEFPQLSQEAGKARRLNQERAAEKRPRLFLSDQNDCPE